MLDLYATLSRTDSELGYEGVLFGNGLKISKERQSNQMYFRTKMNHEFTFVRGAYDAIVEADLNDEFVLKVFSRSRGKLGEGRFYKTACAINVDDRSATVNLQMVDAYERILEGAKNTYNIVKLEPEVASLHMQKRTILQVYRAGDPKLTNLMGNISYETNVAEVSDEERLVNNKFTFIGNIQYVRLVFDPSQPGSARFLQDEPLAQGLYKGNWTDGFYNENGYYYKFTIPDYTQVRRPDGTAVDNLYVHKNGDIYFAIIYGGYEYRRIGVIEKNMGISTWMRFLSDDSLTADSIKRSAIEGGDIAEENLNYRYVTPLGQSDIDLLKPRLIYSAQIQDEPTRWGTNPDGKYFVEPEIPSGYNSPRLVPFAQSYWSPLTYWLINDLTLANVLDNLDTPFVLKDAYTLRGVIEKLLEKITDGEINRVESTFLFSATNPLRVQGMFIPQAYFITPASNVKKTYYDHAAQRGDITLDSILTMLRTTMNCYWQLVQIDPSGTMAMRIEHIDWFRKGGTYSVRPRTPLDITTMECPSPEKMWTYGINSFAYDLYKPKRTEFSWACECTEEFNGYPLEVTEPYMAKGSTEQLTAGGFVTDVDLAIARPSEVNDDYFVFLHAFPGVNEYTVPIGSVNVGENKPEATPWVVLQNWVLSYISLEQYFHNYNLSGRDFKIGDVPFVCNSVARMVKQSVSFPMVDSLQENTLIKTELGIGEIEKMEIDCDSMLVNCDIKLEMR